MIQHFITQDFSDASSERDIDTAFRTLIERRAGGLLVTGDAFFNHRREQLVALAARSELELVYGPAARRPRS